MDRYFVGCLATAALLAGACDQTEPETPTVPLESPTVESPAPTATAPSSPGPSPTASPTPTPEAEPVEFDPGSAFETIRWLAEEIGPREGTSEAFHEAAAEIEERLARLGYDVTQVPVPVPAGNSWGVGVPEGESANVVADPPGFDPAEPHVIIGAHLDTVPQAPGAEDNGSGVAVLMELARMAAEEQVPVPVRFIAFGAEEPRGEGDDLHHFGSQQYVADMRDDEREALRAMVSLDRVGVGAEQVPVCTGGTGTVAIRDELVEAAEDAEIPAATCENRASDHWSFEKAGLPAARLGSVPFAGYHSRDDVPSVIDTDQLDRVGRLMWTWLTTR